MDSVLNPTHPIRGTQGAAYQRLLAFGLEGDPGKAWQPEALPKRVYQTLIAATTEVPDESAPRRRPSLFTDGTKAGYSFQTQIHPPIASSPPSLRVLVEPGGTGLDLPGQIDFALATLGKLLQILAWQRLAADINRTARLAFPEDPSQLSHWWGGIWLGAEMGVEDTDLRIYLNLRSGQSTQRWQRVADILAPYAPKALEPSFLALAEQTVRCAGIPVGLAMVLRQGGLGGIRLYVGLDHPTPATVAAAMPPGTGSPGQLKERMDHLVKTFGAFEYNAVTVSYDFPIRDGVMLPGVARFKADVGCSSYLESAPRQFHAWLNEDLGPCASHRLDVFRQRMDRAFGGSQVDYLSFGFRKGGAIERTCYLQPSGLAPRDF